jgi:hypothetical protein
MTDVYYIIVDVLNSDTDGSTISRLWHVAWAQSPQVGRRGGAAAVIGSSDIVVAARRAS